MAGVGDGGKNNAELAEEQRIADKEDLFLIDVDKNIMHRYRF